ncbi:MAG: hypothetical protein HZA46_19435 [Planctomycetales bacterium]|nr:hypothetical protein [Planctomycetales bacterium]
MAIKSDLLSVLRGLELRSTPALVRFRDGDAYIVRVISTIHAEEGDNVVAEVVRVASVASGSGVPDGAFMDFVLADVAQVSLAGECLFTEVPEVQ